MRQIVAALALSFASLLPTAATARAEAVPDGRAPPAPEAQQHAQQHAQQLQRVRAELRYLREELGRREAELARLQPVHAIRSTPQPQELERRIAETERELVEMRTRRGYTDEHPSVKRAVQALAELRGMQTGAHGEATPTRSRGQRAAAEEAVAALRGQLRQLTAMEHELVAAMPREDARKPRQPARPPRAHDGGARRPPPRRAAGHDAPPRPHAAAPGPRVEERLQRLERAVEELSRALKQRQPERRRADDRGDPRQARDVDVMREKLQKLDRMLGAEREESNGLRKVVKGLEKRVAGAHEEAERLRDTIRRMKAERSDGDVVPALEAVRGENEELREAVRELEKRARVERMEADELRKALQRAKRGEPGDAAKLRRTVEELEKRVRAEQEEAEELREMLHRKRDERTRVEHEEREGPGDAEARELRGHVRGLEKRLQVMQHENRELREVVNELETELEALRAKLERR